MPIPFYYPPLPELKYGVWDFYGVEATPESRVPITIGWKIANAVIDRRRSSVSREEIEPQLANELIAYTEWMKRQKLSLITPQMALKGQVITGIRTREGGWYSNHLSIDMQRGGAVVLKTSRYGWSAPAFDLPLSPGPWTVKLMLSTGKAIRLTNGESITFDFYGKFKIEDVPDWLLGELFE
jgi:hypothetical protein